MASAGGARDHRAAAMAGMMATSSSKGRARDRSEGWGRAAVSRRLRRGGYEYGEGRGTTPRCSELGAHRRRAKMIPMFRGTITQTVMSGE